MTTPTIQIDISGMTCSACADRLTRVLSNLPAVAQARVDLAQDRASLVLAQGWKEPSGTQAAIAAIAKAGYLGVARGGTAAERKKQRHEREAHLRSEQRILMMRAVLAISIAIVFFVAMGVEIFGQTQGYNGHGHLIAPTTQFVLASIVQTVCAWPFYVGAIGALRSRAANMDVLVVIGTSTAFGLSLWHMADGSAHHGGSLYFEGSVAVIAFVLLGKLVEKLARREAGAALSALAALIPDQIRVREGDTERMVACETLQTGMRVVVKPGQVLPVDGVICEGQAYLDESSMTGESLPVLRKAGDYVQAGSGVSGGTLLVESTATQDETRLARLARLIEDAGVSQAPSRSLVDRISAIFVPGVIVLALLAFAGWWFQGVGIERALIIAASVLVVACPCALGLATPIVLVAGASSGARQGLLLADHAGLEAGAELTHLAFDKTGTLTLGHPGVAAVRTRVLSEEEALALASRLATHSDHPLDAALVREARARGVFRDGIAAFEAQSGAGLSGQYEGQALRLGSLDFVARDDTQKQAGACLYAALGPDLQAQPAAYLGRNGDVLALFVFGDQLRAEAVEAVAGLKALGVVPVMLSGDRQAVVAAIAAHLGIADARGDLKPEGKVQALHAIRDFGACLGFVGDGLNDGPALRIAQVGIAMGTGTEVAKGAASVVLVRPDLRLVPLFVRLARRTRLTVRENLALAFLFNGIAIPLAMAGKLSPALAGAAMALSSVFVVLNAVRLSRWRG